MQRSWKNSIRQQNNMREGETMGKVKIMAAGDCAVTVEFGQGIDTVTNDRVHAFTAALKKEGIPGVTEAVPAFCSLLIYYDPLKTSFHKLIPVIESLAEGLGDIRQEKKRVLKIPCCYGARFGPDLADMESYTGLDRDEIIRIHSSVDYKIYMMGFLPGFVYLGGLDERIQMPRLETPRVRILPGAVGIGGSQTGVYPLASPGGWRLMGGTPVDFYNPERENPVLCKAGEYIRFVPITIGDYYDIRQMAVRGSYQIETVEEGEKECQ